MRRIKPIKKVTYVQLVLAHILLGLVVYSASFTAKFILMGIIVYFLIRIFNTRNKNDDVLLAAAYVTGFEVFSRMTGGMISYEFAKITVIGFMLIGMFYRGFKRRSWPYAIFLFFLIPGILFSAINLNYESNFINAISFNLSGPICLAITALYCYNRKMSEERLQHILLAIVLPLISMTMYLYVFTPNIRDVLTGTQSNFEASGGFGPNQVATVLGLGMFILFTRLFIIKSRLVNIIDLILLVFMSYRAIVTFSRGGVITAAICAVAFFIIFFISSKASDRAILLPKISLVGAAVLITWFITSISTFGLIDKRYANQDASGRDKDDLTTGRAELFVSELQAFYEFPLTGIGVGKVKEFREAEFGRVSASHNEVTRMLSEHGLFGLFSLLVLLFAPLIYRMRNRTNVYFFSFLIFWLLTINHSSMRIAAPAFIYGLALITIIRAKQKSVIHRE